MEPEPRAPAHQRVEPSPAEPLLAEPSAVEPSPAEPLSAEPEPSEPSAAEPSPAGLRPELQPPVLGRPSPASRRPGALRPAADTASAAYRADGGDGAGWSVRAASIAGVRHRLAGRGPEDAYAWRVLDAVPAKGEGPLPATVILAVADGVGSVEGSAAAAAAAVVAASDALLAGLASRADGGRGGLGGGRGDRAWQVAFDAADAAVGRAGGASTLVLAVIGGDRRASLARVGDSSALVLAGGGWTELWPSDPSDGVVATGTAALRGRAVPAIEVADVVLDADTVLVVVTDGIANPLRDGPTTVAPALAEALVGAPTPLGLALVADFARQGCFDDRTVVGLWPRAVVSEPGPVLLRP